MKYDYDLIVLGGGAAGLVAATGGASLGAKTALIEKNKLGGDCTWYGCIPSKTLLKSAQVFSLIKRLKEFGISISRPVEFDVSRVMPHVRDIVNKISTHHPAKVFEDRGIKVFFGESKFINNKTIELNGNRITSKRFIISTGSHPLAPPIEGLKDFNYLTNENIFDLEVLPKSITVLGAGPIGVELAQALCRLGVEVSIVEMFERILFREDEEASYILTEILNKEGIKLYLGKRAIKFSPQEDSISITLEDKNKNQEIIKSQKALIAVGRAPNVAGLELEMAGIKFDNKGIAVNSTLQTSAKNIYACGDVVGPYQFSHMAEYQAIIAVGNALFPFKRKANYCNVSWAVFTEPEIAHLGLTEEEARARYRGVKVYRSSYSGNDRAVTDIEENGFAKVICDKKGKILGAHIIGANAAEIIPEFILAKSKKLPISAISSCIHIYPTIAQINKKTADEYYFALLKSKWFIFLSRLMLKFLR